MIAQVEENLSINLSEIERLAKAGELFGRFPGLPSEFYHWDLAGISKSDIEKAAISPANMIARKVRGDMDREALLIGTMLHSRIEFHENIEKFKSLFLTMPKFSGEGSRKAKEEWMKAHEGRHILDAEQVETVEHMFSGLLANPQSKALVQAAGSYEDTIVWKDPDTGVLCKCRPDKYLPDYMGTPMTLDWKKIGQFSKKKCEEAIYEYGYNVSAAFTRDGMRAVGINPGPYVFVFVGEKEPNEVLCIPCRDIDEEIGRRKYKRVLAQIAESQKSGIWTGFVDAGIPAWAVEREMAQLSE